MAIIDEFYDKNDVKTNDALLQVYSASLVVAAKILIKDGHNINDDLDRQVYYFASGACLAIACMLDNKYYTKSLKNELLTTLTIMHQKVDNGSFGEVVKCEKAQGSQEAFHSLMLECGAKPKISE